MSSDTGHNQEPLVTVSLITYNHAAYIRECLDSLLNQQTRFCYEICIGEDGSTDGTREICVEYAEAHPDRIRLFLRERNEPGREDYLSQGIYNYIKTARAGRGKYTAFCDGDDAWIDPCKLQKQVDVVKADPSVALVHSDVDILDEVSGRRMQRSFRRQKIVHRVDPDTTRFRYDVLQRNYPIAASTVLVRTADVLEVFGRRDEVFRQLPMGDTTTWCELVDYGTFVYVDESLGLYRILPESESNSRSAVRKFSFVNAAANHGLLLGRELALPMDLIRANKVRNCNRYALLTGDLEEICSLRGNKQFRFSFAEHCIFHAASTRWIRPLAKSLFMLKYRINNHGFSMRWAG